MKLRMFYVTLFLFAAPYVQLHAKNRGLANCGNSCFFNSSLQALSHLTEFNALINANKSNDLGIQIYDELMSKLQESVNTNPVGGGEVIIYKPKKETLASCYAYFGNTFWSQNFVNQSDEELQKLYKASLIEIKLTEAQYPFSAFISQFQINEQQDAGEFINLLTDLIFKSIDSRAKEQVKSLINVGLVEILEKPEHEKCSYNRSDKSEYQDSLKLPVPITGESTLKDCFMEYFKRENLKGAESVDCANCHKKVEAFKQLRISKLPKYLIISLNRFYYDKIMHAVRKIVNPVRLTNPLVMNEYCSDELSKKIGVEKLIYHLRAFIVHGGSTPNSGHYWAYGNDGSAWFRYEDSSVTEASTSGIINTIITAGIDNTSTAYKNATPYILFYELDKASEEILKKPQPEPKPVQDPLVQKINDLKKSVEKVKDLVADVQKNLEPLKNKLKV